ncbi:MAG: hypothetical protein WAN22_33205 [Solirubrobacteraceae bacterium]
MRKSITRNRLVLLSVSVLLVAVLVGASAATGSAKKVTAHAASSNPTITYGPLTPTFVGPAATGCKSGCSLLTGPYTTTSTPSSPTTTNAPATLAAPAGGSGLHQMPAPTTAGLAAQGYVKESHVRATAHVAQASTPVIPTVRCQPLTLGCDTISSSAGGATGVKGLNAVDSATHTTNEFSDVEPPDQGLCAGNGSVVETNNIGEILVFNSALQRTSAPISLDTIMGLTSRAWSSGGDPSCEFDPSNGGHWFFTEIVSASPESTGGAFTGCFSAVANECYEGIAVSQGSSPTGPYYVYYVNADYNPKEPGYPYLLNDFAKIGVTRDAFLLFYDEFPLNTGAAPGFGGGFFNGAQEFAFDKSALEHGRRVTLSNGGPNTNFNVARENMGLLATPDGPCAGTSTTPAGVDCWVAVIPAQPADSGQFDNHYNGSGFMMDVLDFNSFAGIPQVTSYGDNRMGVWYWTGLHNLDTGGCGGCSAVKFGGQIFTGTNPYYDPETPNGFLAPQKAGPIPLGNECGAAGLSTGNPPPASCPENGLNTNGDFMFQASQAQGSLWGATPTEVNQQWNSGTETHAGALYFVVDTGSFDKTHQFTLTDQGYVTAAHEDMLFPAMAAEGTGGNDGAIMSFTLSGNGGPTGADKGGYYPSSAYGRLTATSSGLTGSVINIADLGKSPQDGFSEYQGYPGGTRPRWGDYGWGIFMPGTDRLYFSSEYIQYPNCAPPAFTLTIGTCGGTRDGNANWGTSVNYVVP